MASALAGSADRTRSGSFHLHRSTRSGVVEGEEDPDYARPQGQGRAPVKQLEHEASVGGGDRRTPGDATQTQGRRRRLPSEPGVLRLLRRRPRADLTPWPAGSVTALGDAVHATPPTGGRSAATAIRDADQLACRLAAVPTGKARLPTALADFHRDMRATLRRPSPNPSTPCAGSAP